MFIPTLNESQDVVIVPFCKEIATFIATRQRDLNPVVVTTSSAHVRISNQKQTWRTASRIEKSGFNDRL